MIQTSETNHSDHAATDSASLLQPQNASRFAILLLVWSFTPLAVVVSVQEVSSLWAFAIRFLCAAPLSHLLLKILGERLPTTRASIKSYAAGALGIFAAMLLTYLAAASLPSSIISMVFGLSPLVSGLIGLILYHKQLKPMQWFGILLGLLGLGLALGLFTSAQHLDGGALGLVLAAMLLSVVSLYVVNHVQTEEHLRLPTRFRRPRLANGMTLVRLSGAFEHVAQNDKLQSAGRRLKQGMNNVKNFASLSESKPTKPLAEKNTHVVLTSLAQTVGALWVSFFGVLCMLPFIWHAAPSTLPSLRALTAVGFLVVFASLLAFVLLYDLNRRVSPTAISLITILTPILATIWGAWFNHETISDNVLYGLGCIVFALGLFVRGGMTNSAG